MRGEGREGTLGQSELQAGRRYALQDGEERVTLFTIGGEVQTNEAFDRQVRARFGDTFEAAWKEALEYVETFPKETLLSTVGFFGHVYRPTRQAR